MMNKKTSSDEGVFMPKFPIVNNFFEIRKNEIERHGGFKNERKP